MSAMGPKKRKLAQVAAEATEGASTAEKDAQKSFFKNAANWNLEQDYETRPRKGKKKEPKESNKLPIKTADGRLEILNSLDAEGDDVSVESDTEWLEGREDDIEWEPEEEEEKAPTIPESQQIIEAQEEMAKLAMALNENPEDNIVSLKTLAKYGESEITAIQMLALMTQMAVYKDIIPGYRIRPLMEEEQKETTSKDIRKLRQFEQSLVSGYQHYVKELNRVARLGVKARPGTQSISNVAYTCACTLLTAVPHFNFRSELLKTVVWKLSRRRVDADGHKCLQALETLFRQDDEGRPSMEAVSLLTKMMKSREYQVDQLVLNLFLALRLLSEFRGTASKDGVDKEGGGGADGEDGGASAQQQHKGKKNKREFRTKRERKMLKEQKSIAKEMTQADALVSHEERERMQSETLKMVFACYFRILKLREPHLMGAVLEGLAKYARLINQDFFGDLLEALKDLIRHSIEDADAEGPGDDDEAGKNGAEDDGDDDEDAEPSRNLTREALLCTVTAHTLLAGQDAHDSRNTLHLDLSYFTTHLYRSLLDLSTNPDLELTKPSSSAAAAAAGRSSRINVQTTTVLLLRSLTAILLPPWNVRSVPPLRLAAFTKQLMTSSLQLPEKSCQGTLALLGDVAHTHGRKISSLWNTEERKGDGRFNPFSDSVEGSNPFATTVWEGELLRKHYSPKVREGHELLVKRMNSK
ncbi:nuclear export protein Noc3 [Cordyceps fumosorosea ARSEF 2679]|uniref:Nucleolar complex-associated protein 3 n=1 Tax=Cordyceps fumosorosea (strain ARSEF 2679) TaxID=1081104 RepID=A0A168CHX9_CORFA|nr:nuclear export protein Noc3 [Cordyceps fumosorosea ARSEF 2679]OAA71397.1 nuclear export protein Noc3 [Cordyceps fumosorosea ARSEF 2679]